MVKAMVKGPPPLTIAYSGLALCTCAGQARRPRAWPRSKQISGGLTRKWVWLIGGGGGGRFEKLIGQVHLSYPCQCGPEKRIGEAKRFKQL